MGLFFIVLDFVVIIVMDIINIFDICLSRNCVFIILVSYRIMLRMQTYESPLSSLVYVKYTLVVPKKRKYSNNYFFDKRIIITRVSSFVNRQ